MAKRKRESFFWTSYSDLMTSMFFVMLVLFVLTTALMHSKQKATEEQLNKIKEIEESINNIDAKYFEYNTEHKKHILRINVNFKVGSSDINDIPEDILYDLKEAGNIIRDFILKTSEDYNIKYLLVIEGQASKDNYMLNYQLSYERALALRNFWRESYIDFGEDCEVLISGSGIEGTMRDKHDEAKNQRFLIHIIPKPGIIE